MKTPFGMFGPIVLDITGTVKKKEIKKAIVPH